MKWKLTTLIENHIDKEEKYRSEHGFSILIEGIDKERPIRVLMDTGKSGLFFDNAIKMGISLENLDALCISHAHYDHAGGVKRLLKESNIGKIYVGKNFFQEKYYKKKDGSWKNIGISFSKKELEVDKIAIYEMKEDTQMIFPGITLYQNFEQSVDYESLNPNFFVKRKDSGYTKDYFDDEIAVTLDVEDGLIVIVGCSHPGIMNIIKTIEKRSRKKICGIVGGTHLMEADGERLRKTIEDLKERKINIMAVSHCTGEENLQIIKENFGKSFIFNCTGNEIFIS